jgi:hypothetical protein
MTRLFTLVIVLAAGLGVVAGCGGEERLSRDDFSDRLQSIGQEGSERWGALAQRAVDLKPGQPIPADVEQSLRELVEFQRQAVSELEGLNAPEDAGELVEMLIDALRERTARFEQAIDAGSFTERRSGQITQSGEKIDEAFERLRNDGFLPKEDAHEDE